MRAAALAATLAASPALAGEDRILAGRAFAETHCAGCHAIDGLGPSPVATATPFARFSEKWPVDHIAEALAEGISVGHRGVVQMPEFVLSPDEIDQLLAYLASVQMVPPEGPPDPSGTRRQ